VIVDGEVGMDGAVAVGVAVFRLQAVNVKKRAMRNARVRFICTSILRTMKKMKELIGTGIYLYYIRRWVKDLSGLVPEKRGLKRKGWT